MPFPELEAVRVQHYTDAIHRAGMRSVTEDAGKLSLRVKSITFWSCSPQIENLGILTPYLKCIEQRGRSNHSRWGWLLLFVSLTLCWQYE